MVETIKIIEMIYDEISDGDSYKIRNITDFTQNDNRITLNHYYYNPIYLDHYNDCDKIFHTEEKINEITVLKLNEITNIRMKIVDEHKPNFPKIISKRKFYTTIF